MPTTYAIPDGRTVMAATLYTGTDASQSISNAVNSVSFQPDLVWRKARSAAESNILVDAVRGVSIGLISNSTNAETSVNSVTAFTSNGFTGIGSNAVTYVAWQWNAGGSTVTNTSGSISSQVRANTTAGFSIVTYTGTGANATVGHGLGVAPKMMIFKNRTLAGAGWPVWHTSFVTATTTDYLLLNTTGAKGSLGAASFWNGVSTSTVLNLGTDSWVNQSTAPIVAYCFAAVAGYSAFGSYTGNGSADGPFLYFGFRPRWVMIKRTDTAGYNWGIWDTSVNTYNLEQLSLYANSSGSEINATDLAFDGVSNGIKIRGNSLGINASGGTFIYAAFCENPFKFANAR